MATYKKAKERGKEKKVVSEVGISGGLWKVARAGLMVLTLLTAYRLSLTTVYGATANSPWGGSNVSVAVSIQNGTAVSAWEDRGDITGGAYKWMTAIGDGTYEYAVDLVPGSVYNYIFFASATAVNAAYTRTAEPCPNTGSDQGTYLTLFSTSVTQPANGSLAYGTANTDGRRILTMPDDTVLPAGSTLYVYNNFASTPTGVANYTTALVSSASVKLDWKGALGYWGNGTGALDVLGGKYFIYRSTTASSGPYNLLTASGLSGETSVYIDSSAGLQSGVTAYYVFVSSDAYNGTTNPTSKTQGANLARLAPGQTGFGYDTSQYTMNDKSAKPATPVRVIFKVENIDEEYVLEHDSIVYMTPWEEDGRIYTEKVPGTFMRVYIPKM